MRCPKQFRFVFLYLESWMMLFLLELETIENHQCVEDSILSLICLVNNCVHVLFI